MKQLKKLLALANPLDRNGETQKADRLMLEAFGPPGLHGGGHVSSDPEVRKRREEYRQQKEEERDMGQRAEREQEIREGLENMGLPPEAFQLVVDPMTLRVDEEKVQLLKSMINQI